MTDDREELAKLLRDRARALRQIVREHLRPYEMELITALNEVADDLDQRADMLERAANGR
jgi:hypothetical protein